MFSEPHNPQNMSAVRLLTATLTPHSQAPLKLKTGLEKRSFSPRTELAGILASPPSLPCEGPEASNPAATQNEEEAVKGVPGSSHKFRDRKHPGSPVQQSNALERRAGGL